MNLKNLIAMHYPVVGTLDHDFADRILSRAKLVTLKSGVTVFEDMMECRAFPFVLSGSLRVVKRAENGREITLYNLMPGDACAISSACIFGKEPYNACGQVISDCELVLLPTDDFNDLLSNEAFRDFIFSLFAKRVSSLMQLIEEVVFHRLDQRLAAWLLAKGPEIDVSHQHLADELGTVREIISRILSDFAQKGYVATSRGHISISDPRLLQKIIENNPA